MVSSVWTNEVSNYTLKRSVSTSAEERMTGQGKCYRSSLSSSPAAVAAGSCLSGSSPDGATLPDA